MNCPIENAEVAELADALDSGSSGVYALWGFKSPLRHQSYQGVVALKRCPFFSVIPQCPLLSAIELLKE